MSDLDIRLKAAIESVIDLKKEKKTFDAEMNKKIKEAEQLVAEIIKIMNNC